ncbi:membrane magnesium transporter-domain-containing protein [Jimgerdemannia flammicorona]|uniref:Membrane magnesium transporter-domain-containing protein n=1 Tax=Jimgerdemannia flammicorona TaxID=994334 RepID=A0A433A653_9FUNG|nr:membrane magnesium transporter-domain-containing protein [Jimgerdemannia flammicorona]
MSPKDANWPGRFFCVTGLLLLSHSAYSTYERTTRTDLAYLKAVDRSETGLPLDIIIECLVSVLFFMVGVTLVAGDLKEILMETEMSKQTIDKLDARPSFITFNHRGRKGARALKTLTKRNL